MTQPIELVIFHVFFIPNLEELPLYNKIKYGKCSKITNTKK